MNIMIPFLFISIIARYTTMPGRAAFENNSARHVIRQLKTTWK